MKKFLAIALTLLLAVGFAAPAQSTAAKYTVYQKTLATFSSTTTTLTSQQRAQVKAAVEANPDAEKFVCTGIRYYSQPMSINIMVRKRAKAACEYAKQLNPELSTWYQNKPTQARSYAGKVLLTVKTPERSAPTDPTPSEAPSSPEAGSFQFQALDTWVQAASQLMVKVSRLELNQRAGSTQLLLEYQMENRTRGAEIVEGSFALFFDDGSKLRQYGFFNKIFPGGSSTRNYTFEWVGEKTPRLIEFETDFFASEPSTSGLKWKVTAQSNSSEHTPEVPPTSDQTTQPGFPFSPLTAAGDEYPTIGRAWPGSQAELIQPNWINAVADTSSIQWQTCYHLQVDQRSWDAPPLGPVSNCPVIGAGTGWTLPSWEQFVSYNNKMAYLAVTLRYDEIDPATKQKTGRYSFLRTSRTIDGLELRAIENVSLPQIQGEVRPESTISMDFGTWKYAKPITDGTWLICREFSEAYVVKQDTWSITGGDYPGCMFRFDITTPLTLGSLDYYRQTGFKEIRGAFFVRGEGWTPSNSVVIVSKPILFPEESPFAFEINSERRQMCLPDMECVVASYTITNTSDSFAAEEVPVVEASSGKSYSPLRFATVDIPPGQSQTRQVTWQIRDELQSSMQIKFGNQKPYQLREPSTNRFPSITGVTAEISNGRTVIRWEPVDSYVDGRPLEDEGFEDGTVVQYFTELTGISSQTQRRFNTFPGDSFSTTSGVEVRVWVMGKRSISEPVSFYVFEGEVYFR